MLISLWVGGEEPQYRVELRTHAAGMRPGNIILKPTIPAKSDGTVTCESGPLRAVHLSRHKWPGGLVN